MTPKAPPRKPSTPSERRRGPAPRDRAGREGKATRAPRARGPAPRDAVGPAAKAGPSAGRTNHAAAGDPEEPFVERRARRALSHVGGPIEKRGADARVLSVLDDALRVRSDERATQAHVHGFHSYPARLHPDTAARLVEGLSRPGDSVLDPFCGSGTVLVEAHRLGRRALGIDANPLAIELAWLKTRGFDATERASLVDTAKQVAEHADARRIAKAGPTRKYPPSDLELFDVHVLLELDGLRDGIERLARGETKRALLLVLSALLTKVSRRPGDTTQRVAERRLSGGFVVRFFVKKTEELARRLLEYAARLRPDLPEVLLAVGDARKLDRVRDGGVDLIVTSPPYPGVYDYHAHHEVRLRWLGLDDRRFERREIGARRAARGQDYARALATWKRDLGACLGEMRRVLGRRGLATLVIADSAIATRALRADELLSELAPEHGLEVIARASQARPHFHGPSQRVFRSQPRREHVVVLGRR